MAFAALPRSSGRIAYRHRTSGERWGQEDFTVTRDAEANRTLTAHCEMQLGDDDVVRETILVVDAAFQPTEAYVRILNGGYHTGSGWYRLTDDHVLCENWTRTGGRQSLCEPIARPLRGFGVHALIGDGWLGAPYPFEKGPCTTHSFGRNPMHSLHHFGATGPHIEFSTSSLAYDGTEKVTVPAGTFDCKRMQVIGMDNGHPPYTFWITAGGDHLYVRGEVSGEYDSYFELEELT